MSIASEINRLSQNISDSLDAVAAKGVVVPSGSTSDNLPTLIAQIPTGGGGGVIIADTTDSHGGTVRTITATEISGTKTITQNGVEDVTSYAAVSVNVSSSISIVDETNATGTTAVVTGESGGGGGGATQHSIYFEFSDQTNTTIPVYYDNALISTMITEYTPTTYGQKTVTLAQLDGVTWYNPADIPLNTQLIDYLAVVNGYEINGANGEELEQQWNCCSDYTAIDPTMTFTYRAYRWLDMAFYDSNKTFISGVMQQEYADSIENDYANGTLTSARIPSNAAYIRLSTTPRNPDSSTMSLIRTA